MQDTDAHVSWWSPLGSCGEQHESADAREAERRSLARDLHDTVIQPLTSLVMSFTCFEQQLPISDSMNHNLILWSGLAQEALDSLRATLAGFGPFVRSGSGLPEALHRSLAPQLGSRGLRLNVESRGWPPDLPPDWNWQVYLAVREALTNVEKHARASEVNAHLRAEADSLVITIVDDGIGLHLDELATGRLARPGCGLGMSSIVDRLSMLGGHLSIAAEPGRGVRLEMRLPRPPDTGTIASSDRHGCPDPGRVANQNIH